MAAEPAWVSPKPQLQLLSVTPYPAARCSLKPALECRWGEAGAEIVSQVRDGMRTLPPDDLSAQLEQLRRYLSCVCTLEVHLQKKNPIAIQWVGIPSEVKERVRRSAHWTRRTLNLIGTADSRLVQMSFV
jgi:hypothetical protein